MRVDELNYDLPTSLIAQRPLEQRDASRLLVVERALGQFADAQFSRLAEFLAGNELIVFNNARVIPARLFGKREGVYSQKPSRKTVDEHLTGNVEVFLTRRLEGDLWEALVRPGKKMQVGERVKFGKGELEAEIVSRGELGIRTIRFVSRDARSIEENLELLGHVPLPPYIERPDEAADRERYQTVYAQRPGAVAAPTAGLHFTPGILESLKAKGCELCEVTLDVGLGTFQPVHTEKLEEHKIHSEAYEISAVAAEKIRRAKSASLPVLAVGTTVVRALEDAAARAAASGRGEFIAAGRADAQIFLLPGHEFRVVNKLLTNFHLPKSTLLALVSAFAGRENILRAYRHAVRESYRFYSYGDCMLIR
ncbi:MAG TPA: tRNA preQ1(34) S-adenosylmethionine ribosyltransferase-isomerase QueA [Candidatus Limnocylindrales bacterium]|nr:tRNA preQ1(34) S-adenosylmethionine ribosyltransferase-isomerase QueA [Candidatus Limnocylindrales bacterium]